ncbi:MAG TPA: hypothetical protein VN843_01845, partial [Anaerolineales bacterium]|nr:hypothetical protein [Anaerolineales bacterium]
VIVLASILMFYKSRIFRMNVFHAASKLALNTTRGVRPDLHVQGSPAFQNNWRCTRHWSASETQV